MSGTVLTRTSSAGGPRAVVTTDIIDAADGKAAAFEVAQRIAWCATDNLGMSKAAARAAAVDGVTALSLGRPYTLDRYTFTLTPGSTS